VAITNATLDGSNAITGKTDTSKKLGELIGSASNNTITAGAASSDVTLASTTAISS
jgi:hypothetical protein